MRRRHIAFIVLGLALLFMTACGQKAPTWQEQYDLGLRYLEEGNYEEAIIAFTAAIEIDPRKADAYIGLADVYEAQGDIEQAHKILTDALVAVDDADIIQNRLDALIDQNTTESPIDSESSFLTEPTVETADYTIQKQDLSFYDNDGQPLILLTYDLVTLTGDTPEINRINQDLYQKYIDFYASEGGREEFAQFLDDPYLTSECPYFDTGEAEVMFNNRGVISIVIAQNWMMGGVHNLNYYGYSYDLNTGESLVIETAFTDVDFSAPGYQSVEEYLDSITLDYVLQHPEKCDRDTALWTIESYTIEDYNFFIQEDGEFVLCFPTYALGGGAQGPTLIPTGLYI